MDRYTVLEISRKHNVPEGEIWSLARKIKKLGYNVDIYLEPLVRTGAERGQLGERNKAMGWPSRSPFDMIEGTPIDERAAGILTPDD